MEHYQGDPYWLTTRFVGTCLKCGKSLRKGTRAWFYPRTRYHRTSRTYCAVCGGPMSREFLAAAEDEAFLSGQFRGGHY